MLDVRTLRADPQGVAKALRTKGFDLDVQRFETLEASRKTLQQDTEQLQNERNTSSRAIGKAKAQGEDIEPLLAAVKNLGDKLDACQADLIDMHHAVGTRDEQHQKQCRASHQA